MKIKSIKEIILTEEIPVYDITVNKYHNFAIGESKIIVHNCYQHSEAGISGVISNMAQNYVGSNNIPLLKALGSFGNRLNNGVPAAPRYTFTELSKSFREIFNKNDDCILEYKEEDGELIEPYYYVPILPNILINGSEGLGVGYASKILSYHPETLKQNILNILHKKRNKPLVPWYKGFKGIIERDKETGQVIFKGNLEIVNSTTIKITELPIGTYLEKYKEILNKLEDDNIIKSYDDNSTDDSFEFIITTYREITKLSQDELLAKFKLISKDTENCTLWSETGKIRVFNNVDEILEYFVNFRLNKYEERRIKQINILEEDIKFQKEKLKFIQYYIANSELFSKKNKKEIEALLLTQKFHNEYINDFLNIKIYNLTGEEIDKLKRKIKDISDQIDLLKNITNIQMYENELKELNVN